jgi:hypothetical protein
MSLRHLMLAPALVFGCAHAPSVTSEQVVRLPDASRQQILNAQRSVDVADQNVSAAKVAVDEARRFREIAVRELDGARARADAANRTLELGQRSHTMLRDARQNREMAVREVFAARAKKDYADRLIELRSAEEDQRRADKELARADFEYVKFVQLRENNVPINYTESDFVSARDKAQEDVATARNRVANLRGSVESLRTAWLQRANEFQTASRGAIIPAPAPPQPLENQLPSERMEAPPTPSTGDALPPAAMSPAPPMPPMPEAQPRTFTPPPNGAANEGPSAPQSLPQD